LNTAANNYLPENIEISIKVESLNGVESVLQRDENENSFNTEIF
ncbi:CamS family sex pheromone protein, partial [Salmonella enterica subsp. enterica serovar Enteritidis]